MGFSLSHLYFYFVWTLINELKYCTYVILLCIFAISIDKFWNKVCLQEAYDKFQKDKLSKGSKAWDEIEQAYYEMIVRDYEMVIY